MLAITSGGRFLRPVNGLPGASRIMKNDTVMSTSIVGMAASIRLKMNFSMIVSCPGGLRRLQGVAGWRTP